MKRFIVGTGRCGSTLLARMMTKHPEALCIDEVISGIGYLDPSCINEDRRLSGAQLVELLMKDFEIVNLALRKGYPVKEVTYRFSESAKYKTPEGIPWILAVTLPHMSNSPDELFEQLLIKAASLPDQALSQQLVCLFDYLTQELGKEVWIERSGVSINRLDWLASRYPGSKFLHIHRNPRETALSLRSHTMLKMLPLAYSQWKPDGMSGDALGGLLDSPAPCHYYGRTTSALLAQGYRAIAKLDSDQYEEVRYEDLIDDPERVLNEIARFFELEPYPAKCLQQAKSLIQVDRKSRFNDLSRNEREALAEACEPAEYLLGRRSS